MPTYVCVPLCVVVTLCHAEPKPQVSVYAANLYDAIKLYAVAASQAIKENVTISSSAILNIIKRCGQRPLLRVSK